MKPKISVIVPVYNVENYVSKCLDSLFKQTYENLEIIIVDDCSTDKSKEVVSKLIEGKDNVKFLTNKKNSGLSFTRNRALEVASGDYIGYIDSDDYVPYDYYEQLITTALEKEASVVVCDIKSVFTSSGQVLRTSCGTLENKRIDFVNNGLAASACNKLFKKEEISKYKFAEGKVNEDLAVILPIIIKADKVAYNDKTFYNYIQRDNSIQNKSFSLKRFDIFYGVKETLKRIEGVEDFEEYKEAIVFEQLIMLFIYVIPKEPSFTKRVKWLRKFNKMSREYDIRKNHFLWDFLASQGAKHRYYYKLLLKLNCNGFAISSSFLISFYNFYRKRFVRPVIREEITMEDLVRLAKIQNELTPADITISVVIPNYNYERFMYQRLYSILSQHQKLNEIIILDDCSSDDSRKLITEIVDKLSPYINIRKVYNETNSGSAFKQWQKGFSLAKSDYVWIAEADDYCSEDLLDYLVKPLKKYNDVMISYSDTAFIDVFGNITLKSIKSEIDIQKSGHWNKSYVNDGLSEIKDYSYLNCTIANVSSCLIKNVDYNKYLEKSGSYKQAGDWLFYVNIMRKGKIAYCNKALNYYRVHGNNVSSTMNRKKHIAEINKIHSYYCKEFNLDEHHKEMMQKRVDFLKECWKVGEDNE